jgi:hypothetical protein
MDLRAANAGVLCFERNARYRWISDFDEPAAIAANFVVSSLVLIPLAAATSDFGQASHFGAQSTVAILLLIVGALASSAAGRVFYQMALTATKDDNGYVTMFFLLIPAFSALNAFSAMVSYRPGKRVEAYGGFLWSQVTGGLASGYLYRVNFAPTIGMRVDF